MSPKHSQPKIAINNAEINTPAIVALSKGGLEIAKRILAIYPGATLHVYTGDAHAENAAHSAVPAKGNSYPITYFSSTAAHLKDLFLSETAIIAVCSVGILARVLGGVLKNKHSEPPVVAVSENGAFAVPFVGGHHGANRMAHAIAEHLQGMAAITTAGDVRFGVGLDDPPQGWVLANPEDAKAAMANLLEGAYATIDGTAGWLEFSEIPMSAQEVLHPVAGVEPQEIILKVTAEAAAGSPERLIYHPPVLALGIGCERDCPPENVQALVAQVFKAHNLAMGAVAGVVSIDLKSDEPAILNMAESLNVPFRCFDAATLEQERPRLHNPSDIVFAEVGCHGVAEGAALAAVGADGILRVAKHKGDKCTCAIAQAAAPIDIAQVGKPRGRLFIVGIGPGQSSWRTPEADKMLALADHIVGYGLYLNLIQAQIEGKQQHIFPLGEEEDRVRHALELAATGKQVALVSSGDAGIYAMAALAFELLDREQRADWGRIDIAVTPGITAMQAAAARAGAPLGHDFCAISLSNLLTPWEHIEKRLYAAADGDFVVSFYNPVSLRRRWQLPKAIDILRTKRAADTPVLLSSNLGRPTESVRHTTLGALHVDDVDMLTIVTVGASISRSFAGTGGRRWMYTPRGYAKKMDTPDLISDGGTPVITKTTDCE